MISVGMDISKEKITVCALKEGCKIIWKPFDVYLNKSKVEGLIAVTYTHLTLPTICSV